ncbi:hypothetical protein PHYBOEH_004855 [Phytophthora boehmeriae]|uniref:Uncharacterized protein n=1 Tax=Phytophthora boehmeriae TaxID=109152 RepID=A0A8T1WL80_9STRA|nr:hypothetical protein PHYBOEH_004855 [Phytophthora boehmeriae]
MERLRVKEAELQVKVESDFRHFSTETQRFQLWEESVRTQEANLESIVAQAMREKERAWQLERQQALQDIQTKQDELLDRERSLTTEFGTLKALKTQVTALQQEVAALEATLSKSGDNLRIAQNSVLQLEKDKQQLLEKVADLEVKTTKQSDLLGNADASNARLIAEKGTAKEELSRFRQKHAELKDQIKLLTAEVKSLHQQLLDLKLEEANAIVAERKKFMKLMDEERDQAQWKENEFLMKMREMQSRLAEREALAEKYQSQYDDEKVHVESLRHDVASLNSLLSQAQATINAKHAAPRDLASFRQQRGVTSNDSYGFNYAPERQTQGGNERTFMMKMMEMMANIQDVRGRSEGEEPDRSAIATPSIQKTRGVRPAVIAATTERPSDHDQEETKRLKEEQDRIEHELLEQREYERKEQARREEQEREIAEQHRQVEDKLTRMRQERAEEEERAEEQRKRRAAEEEARLQEDLARKRAALQEATEMHNKLAEQRLADDQRRLQEEQAFKERQLAEELKFNEEIEAKRRQQQLEDQNTARQKREKEAAEEEQRQQRIANEKQQRLGLEKAQEEGLQAARKKQEEEDRLREEERKQNEAENEERKVNEAAAQDKEQEEWHESSVEEQSTDLSQEESKSDTVGDEPFATSASLTGSPVQNVENEKSESEEMVHEDLGVVVELPSPETIGGPGLTAENAASPSLPEVPAKTPEEMEEERRIAAEEAKKKEDEAVMDVYRQRVLARKAAEKQRQLEQEAAAEAERKEEEERQRLSQLNDTSESDHELELSGGSFAESSAASNSDSF